MGVWTKFGVAVGKGVEVQVQKVRARVEVRRKRRGQGMNRGGGTYMMVRVSICVKETAGVSGKGKTQGNTTGS